MDDRTSRQSDLSTHDQIESSSSSRNRQRHSTLLESLERREESLRQSMRSRRRRSTQSNLLIRNQIDSMSSRSFLSTHENEQTENVQIDVNTTKFLSNEYQHKNLSDFHTYMNNLAFKTCDICNEKFPGLQLHNSTKQCTRCYKDKQDIVMDT